MTSRYIAHNTSY